MSTALLQELHQEVRRLYIAGSDLAAGDFRLKRLLPQFQQLGERAPVFKRLGEGITALIEPGSTAEPVSAAKLQELTLLLESVLYTQGVTAPDGTPGPLRVFYFPAETRLPYRKLAAVRQALTTTGSGRYEIVIEAFKEGVFQDMRLLPLAIAALKDPYAELAEFAAAEILPSYGPAIAEYLMEHFNPAGGRGEVRKLQVIGKVGGAGVLEQIYAAAESGSDDVRVAAIGCLAGHEAYIPALLEWTADKKKTIREAAFAALAAGGSLQGGERLLEAFSLKKDRALVAEALSKWPSARVADQLSVRFMEELREAPRDNEDKKKTETYWNGIEPYLTALHSERNPQLDEAYSYVIGEYPRFISFGWLPLIDQAAWYTEKSDTAESLELLKGLAKQNMRYLPNVFRAAQQQLNPKELYNQFGGTMVNKLKSIVSKEAAQRDQQLLETLERQIMNVERVAYETPWSSSRDRLQYSREMMPAERIAAEWDPRWLDWFIDRDALELVCAFAQPGHERARSYLLEKLQGQKKRRMQEFITNIFIGLERTDMQEEERQELLMSVLENDRLYNPYIFDYYVFQVMLRFPVSYISRIEAIVPVYRYECAQQLEYLLNHLRSQE
ncbi:HEAT repeat domain-containing protein [Paenibacillus sp. IHBB 3054]|uniref:HEAT repeat domain-containing protein n=1 Tax=Paenibacillus sp. IHBB 3054 TaxID=3425689 RepID=UPI003F66B927